MADDDADEGDGGEDIDLEATGPLAEAEAAMMPYGYQSVRLDSYVSLLRIAARFPLERRPQGVPGMVNAICAAVSRIAEAEVPAAMPPHIHTAEERDNRAGESD